MINELINEEPLVCKSEMSPYQRPSETINGLQKRYADIVNGIRNPYFNIGKLKGHSMIEVSEVNSNYNVSQNFGRNQHRTIIASDA